MGRISDEKFEKRAAAVRADIDRAASALGRYEDHGLPSSLAVTEFEQRNAMVEAILHLAETVREVGAKLP